MKAGVINDKTSQVQLKAIATGSDDRDKSTFGFCENLTLTSSNNVPEFV